MKNNLTVTELLCISDAMISCMSVKSNVSTIKMRELNIEAHNVFVNKKEKYTKQHYVKKLEIAIFLEALIWIMSRSGEVSFKKHIKCNTLCKIHYSKKISKDKDVSNNYDKVDFRCELRSKIHPLISLAYSIVDFCLYNLDGKNPSYYVKIICTLNNVFDKYAVRVKET